MKRDLMLPIASLITLVLLTLHLADDIVRGMAPGGLSNLGGTAMVVVWLYATLVLAGRRAGYIIVLIASLLGSGIPVIHMRGNGLGAGRSGGLFFIWTLLAIGPSAIFSVILAVQGLWRTRGGKT